MTLLNHDNALINLAQAPLVIPETVGQLLLVNIYLKISFFL